ncbi:hypothetical protein ACJJTC_002127 [Scirpophaga incertulas]
MGVGVESQPPHPHRILGTATDPGDRRAHVGLRHGVIQTRYAHLRAFDGSGDRHLRREDLFQACRQLVGLLGEVALGSSMRRAPVAVPRSFRPSTPRSDQLIPSRALAIT